MSESQPSFTRISATDAHTIISNGNAAIVDIRDIQSYSMSHITNAKHLDNNSVNTFISSTEVTTPVFVCCYHGNSSQGAAQFLAEQGFTSAYSIDGGFEQWKLQFPEMCEA
jgi:thiosulfate sulfurtransferase